MRMNDTLRFSILVPVYNVEKYLRKCVDSLIDQEYPSDKYEIILVDDGSTDDSGIICDQYAGRYSNIRAIHKENQGLMQARRTGIERSSGEYLVFIDSDDYVNDDLLIIVDKYFKEIDPDFLMLSHYRTEDGVDKPGYLTKSPYLILSQGEMLRLITLSDRYNGIAGKAVRGRILREHLDEIYKYSANVGEDKIQTAYLVKYSFKSMIVRDCPYHYVIRKDSMIHNKCIEDIYEVTNIYSIVRNVICDVIDASEQLASRKREIMRQYDNLAFDGTLDAVFKYNKRKDVPSADKIESLKSLYNDRRAFFERSYSSIWKLSLHNIPRAYLFLAGRYKCLARLDTFLSRLQQLKGANNES